MTDSPVKVGGPYVESEDFTPEPTDIVAQYNTEGIGAHQRIEEVSPIFETDKVKTAQEVLSALDPDDTSVSSDRVLLPAPLLDNEAAKQDLTKRAEATVNQGVVVGGPTPAAREAEASDEEGTKAAVSQEADNASQNSTGANSGLGVHDDADEKKVAGGKSETTDSRTNESSAGSEAAEGSKNAPEEKSATTTQAQPAVAPVAGTKAKRS